MWHLQISLCSIVALPFILCEIPLCHPLTGLLVIARRAGLTRCTILNEREDSDTVLFQTACVGFINGTCYVRLLCPVSVARTEVEAYPQLE